MVWAPPDFGIAPCRFPFRRVGMLPRFAVVSFCVWRCAVLCVLSFAMFILPSEVLDQVYPNEAPERTRGVMVKGQMGSSLTGPLQTSCFWQRTFWVPPWTLFNLLLSSQKCQGVPFPGTQAFPENSVTELGCLITNNPFSFWWYNNYYYYYY